MNSALNMSIKCYYTCDTLQWQFYKVHYFSNCKSKCELMTKIFSHQPLKNYNNLSEKLQIQTENPYQVREDDIDFNFNDHTIYIQCTLCKTQVPLEWYSLSRNKLEATHNTATLLLLCISICVCVWIHMDTYTYICIYTYRDISIHIWRERCVYLYSSGNPNSPISRKNNKAKMRLFICI